MGKKENMCPPAVSECEIVTGEKDKDNLKVSKSKGLVWTKKIENWGVQEFNLFEIYLALINPLSEDANRATVEFSLQEFFHITGIKPTSMSTKELKRILNNMTESVEVYDPQNKTYEAYPLFKKLKAEFDEEWGRTKITMVGNDTLEDYFFNLKDKGGYIKYRLQSVILLRSAAAKKLYSMLKDFCYGSHKWKVSVADLKASLGIDRKSYNSFGEFNRTCLKVYVKQINEFTDINVTYETIKQGRPVAFVEFTITEKVGIKKVAERTGASIPFEGNIVDIPEDDIFPVFNEELCSEADAVAIDCMSIVKRMLPEKQQKQFSESKIKMLVDIIQKKRTETDNKPVFNQFELTDEFNRYVQMIVSSGTEIKNPVNFLKKAIEEGWLR